MSDFALIDQAALIRAFKAIQEALLTLDPLLSTYEVAELLSFTPKYIEILAKRGEFKTYRLPNRQKTIMIRQSSLDGFIKARDEKRASKTNRKP